MAPSLAAVSREELWGMIEAGEPLVLVDALSPTSFAASRLPGAVNIPPPEVDVRAPSSIPDRDTTVVVYCQNPECDSSMRVANRLLKLGYHNVVHYAGGKSEWAEAGLPFEGGRVPS